MSATVRNVLGISNLAAPRPALEIVNAECLCARAWESNALPSGRAAAGNMGGERRRLGVQ
jgi:hypothetical protein